MNSLLPIILIALFGLIKSYTEQNRSSAREKKPEKRDGAGLPLEMQQAIKEFQGRKEKTTRGHGREPDYKDLPIEVQRAIKSFQKPEKKPAKKEAPAKVNEGLKKKRQMKDDALRQATEAALAADRTAEAAYAKEPEPKAEKPSPFGVIERFDETYRPFIYSEVFNKPKCKRK